MGTLRLYDQRLDALYDYIVAYKRENGGRSPTRQLLSEALGFSSTAVVQGYLLRLAADRRVVLGRDGRHCAIGIPGERWLAPGESMTEEHGE